MPTIAPYAPPASLRNRSRKARRGKPVGAKIVGEFADHLPLNRQQTIFARHGVELSRKTMGYAPTRQRAGPEKFLEGYKGYLEADAYGGYDALFVNPARGFIELGCYAHSGGITTRLWIPTRRRWVRYCY